MNQVQASSKVTWSICGLRRPARGGNVGKELRKSFRVIAMSQPLRVWVYGIHRFLPFQALLNPSILEIEISMQAMCSLWSVDITCTDMLM
jgi:hypothetical protein